MRAANSNSLQTAGASLFVHVLFFNVLFVLSFGFFGPVCLSAAISIPYNNPFIHSIRSAFRSPPLSLFSMERVPVRGSQYGRVYSALRTLTQYPSLSSASTSDLIGGGSLYAGNSHQGARGGLDSRPPRRVASSPGLTSNPLSQQRQASDHGCDQLPLVAGGQAGQQVHGGHPAAPTTAHNHQPLAALQRPLHYGPTAQVGYGILPAGRMQMEVTQQRHQHYTLQTQIQHPQRQEVAAPIARPVARRASPAERESYS